MIIQAPIDITGALSELDELAQCDQTRREEVCRRCVTAFASNWVAQPARHPVLASQYPTALSLAAAAPFDVVVSTCLLSQLMRQLADAGDHLSSLQSVLRDAHLETLVSLTAPGGTGILITDWARSSDGIPELNSVDPFDVDALVDRIIQERRYFGLLSAAEIIDKFQGAAMAGRIGHVRQSKDWIWQLASNKSYLCHAVKFNKKVPDANSSPSLGERMQQFMRRTGTALTELNDVEIER